MKSVSYCAWRVIDALLDCDEYETPELAANATLAYLASFDGLFGYTDEDHPPTTADLMRALKALADSEMPQAVPS